MSCAMVTTEFINREFVPLSDFYLFNDTNLLLDGLHAWLLKRIGGSPIIVNWQVETLSSLHNLQTKSAQHFANIFMETCKNSLRHSNASCLDIEVIELSLRNLRGLALSICDNGCGYSTNLVKKGQGLIKIYSNAAALSADIVVVSDQSGTQVKLWVPAIK